jgi:hypothetical protein
MLLFFMSAHMFFPGRASCTRYRHGRRQLRTIRLSRFLDILDAIGLRVNEDGVFVLRHGIPPSVGEISN